MINAFITQYGEKGSFIIFSGVILNSCVASALFRPPLNEQVERNANDKNKKLVLVDVKDKIGGGLEALKNFPVLLFSAGLSLHYCGYMNGAMMISYAMLDQGYSYDQTALSISSMGISSTMIRVVICLCVDRMWFDTTMFCATSGLLAGISIRSKRLLI